MNSPRKITVRVLRPAKSAMQSGRVKSHQWVIEPENASPRIHEPIMGWSRALDSVSGIKGSLRFSSEEAALAFARHKQWEILTEEPAERRIRPRNYQDNFRIVLPQDEERLRR